MIANVLSILVASLLTILGGLQLLWALGSHFPCPNEQTLARAVIGRRGITRMPSASSCLFVAFWLFLSALLAVALAEFILFPGSKWILLIAGLLAANIFLVRGIVGLLPIYERSAPEEPYLKLNRRVYSPVSFLIGISFFLLVFSMPNWTWRLSLLG